MRNKNWKTDLVDAFFWVSLLALLGSISRLAIMARFGIDPLKWWFGY